MLCSPLRALDLNEYNHVTATYFLLAERKLGAKRVDLAKQIRQRRASRNHEGNAEEKR